MKKRERTSSKGFPYNTDFTRATALELGGKPPSASLVYATRLGAVLRFVNTSQLLFDCVVLRRRRCFIVVFCRPLHYRFGLVGDFYFVLCRFFICSAHTHSVRLNHSQCIFNHYVHQDIVVTFLTLCQSYTHWDRLQAIFIIIRQLSNHMDTISNSITSNSYQQTNGPKTIIRNLALKRNKSLSNLHDKVSI